MSSADKIASGAYKSAPNEVMRMDAGARALEMLRSRGPIVMVVFAQSSEHMTAIGQKLDI